MHVKLQTAARRKNDSQNHGFWLLLPWRQFLRANFAPHEVYYGKWGPRGQKKCQNPHSYRILVAQARAKVLELLVNLDITCQRLAHLSPDNFTVSATKALHGLFRRFL